MANGRPGDHPLTDILVHNMEIGSPETRNLLREIYEMNGRRLNTFQHIKWADDDEVVQNQLKELKKKLQAEG